MCGGGGAGDGGAKKREAARQANITKGYDEIRKIFEGSKTLTDPVSNPVAGQNYYLNENTQITPFTQQVANPNYRRKRGGQQFIDQMFYTDPATGKAVPVSGAHLYGGLQVTPGFDDNFYQQRADAYTGFAMPQLQDQYKQAEQQLLYALARGGRLDSSTRGTKFGKLQQQYDIQKTNVADKAQQYANQARQSVENARSDLVALNQSTADPNVIANQANLNASALRTMPAFDPLAPLFQNATEGLATQADLERRNMARYNTGIFTGFPGGRGSGRTVGA